MSDGTRVRIYADTWQAQGLASVVRKTGFTFETITSRGDPCLAGLPINAIFVDKSVPIEDLKAIAVAVIGAGYEIQHIHAKGNPANGVVEIGSKGVGFSNCELLVAGPITAKQVEDASVFCVHSPPVRTKDALRVPYSYRYCYPAR